MKPKGFLFVFQGNHFKYQHLASHQDPRRRPLPQWPRVEASRVVCD